MEEETEQFRADVGSRFPTFQYSLFLLQSAIPYFPFLL